MPPLVILAVVGLVVDLGGTAGHFGGTAGPTDRATSEKPTARPRPTVVA